MKSFMLTILSGAAILMAMAPGAFAQQAVPQQGVQVIHPATTTARISRSGTFTITATLTTNADLPAGTNISFNGSVSVYDTTYTNSHLVNATAKTAGGKVTVTITIPYTFLVNATSDMVQISLYASASAESSGPSYSFSTNFLSTVALPANNANTPVKFSGSI